MEQLLTTVTVAIEELLAVVNTVNVGRDAFMEKCTAEVTNSARSLHKTLQGHHQTWKDFAGAFGYASYIQENNVEGVNEEILEALTKGQAITIRWGVHSLLEKGADDKKAVEAMKQLHKSHFVNNEKLTKVLPEYVVTAAEEFIAPAPAAEEEKKQAKRKGSGGVDPAPGKRGKKKTAAAPAELAAPAA